MLSLGYIGFAWPKILGLAAGASVGGAVLAPVLGAAFFALYPQLRFKPQERTLTISTSGIDSEIGSKSEFTPWTEIADVAEWNEIVRITLRNVNAFLIPSEAFATPEDRREFIARCKLSLS